ncbi:MAG: DNA-formamidopyrimidine glycosylase family protein [Pseudomonadota bacterium]|nr:DNA-formamidopyrimidine glycosylase family protein [Pseudomonadota bacterium]
MPELPEVEFCRRSLARWSAGRRVVDVAVLDPRSVRVNRKDRPSAGHPDGAAELAAVVTRVPPGELRRHGKRLLWRFGDGALLLHLGMTGKWSLRPNPYVKVRLDLDDGTALHFCDPRLLGGVVPTSWSTGLALLSEGLGPDAWNDPLPALRGARAVKIALMDQSLVAGLGNVQVMEALWRAHIHPSTPCDALTDADRARLPVAIREQLAATLALFDDADEIVYVEEDRSQNPFPIYRHEGQPCPVCGTPIARMVQGGRSTYWCPGCQPART